MKIALFYLASPRFGGWATYTAHLIRQLRTRHEVFLFKLGSRTEDKMRSFGYDLTYQNIHPELAVELDIDLKIIVAQEAPQLENAMELIKNGAWIVFHDPTELKGGRHVLFKHPRVIRIRKGNDKHVPGSVYIPHPYVRMTDAERRLLHDNLHTRYAEIDIKDRNRCARYNTNLKFSAASFARVDFDKNTAMIVQAGKIAVFGWVNRSYMFHTMFEKLGLEPEFYRNYHGRLDPLFHAGTYVATQSDFVVDMSNISGDGGGTQYTFLEAWDAGTPLIINSAWLSMEDRTMGSGWNCLVAGDVAGLRSIIDEFPARYSHVINNGRKCLEIHTDVIHKYESLA